MDGSSFDKLTRLLVEDSSRRSLLKRLAGTALGGAIAVVGLEGAAAKGKSHRAQQATADTKISICHATGSAKNPYNLIRVSDNATKGGHADHPNDIIPAPVDADGKPYCPGGEDTCDPACGANEVCNQGTCECAGGYKLCGTTCIADSDCCTDGTPGCPDSQTCTDGTCSGGGDVCQPACLACQVCTDGTCVDTCTEGTCQADGTCGGGGGSVCRTGETNQACCRRLARNACKRAVNESRCKHDFIHRCTKITN